MFLLRAYHHEVMGGECGGRGVGGAQLLPCSDCPTDSFVAPVHVDADDGGAAAAVNERMPSFPPALLPKPHPTDPTRVLVPYCMRYERSGPNRTVAVREGGEELVCVCNACNNALAGASVPPWFPVLFSLPAVATLPHPLLLACLACL